MTGLAWFMLAVGSLVCGDALLKSISVWAAPTSTWSGRTFMALATAGQIAIFGYLVWVSL